MLGYKLLGVSDWSARVPTLAMTVGEVWLTYLIGRRLVGRIAAWLGGFILLTCIGFFVLHLQILTDHLITLSLLAALYSLLRWEAQPGFRWTALFFLALVAGFLSKGFIGIVFPGLIGLLYAWQLRERRLLRLLFSPGGLALAAILLVAWGWATRVGQSRLSQVPDRQRTDHAVFGPAAALRTSTPLPSPGSMCFWASG